MSSGRSLIVAGNVLYCDFRNGARSPAATPSRTPCTARNVRLTAETLQAACRDLIAGAPAMVRRAELHAADLVSVASMIDELAFQAHVMVLEGHGDEAPVLEAAELQQLLIDGAAVVSEIQSAISESNAAADRLMQRLRGQAELALTLGRGVADALEVAARNETLVTT